ncbi:MAG: class C sortase [Oscillospiraceae bacterium]|nr:class C sortase [Oscillospiraceae bacterium]
MLMFLLALGITLYPLISTWYNERHQSEIHTHYVEVVENADKSEIITARRKANEYNASIVPGAMIEESFTQEAMLAAAEDYDNQLNLGGDGIMGYVEIPLIKVNLPIYHGTDSETLDAGIGHLLGTSLPVGGNSTHTVLTAHSGMANQKLFSDLDKLKKGDVFYLRVLDENLAYQVEEINTVLPHESELLEITEGEDYCTLVTCTPFGINTHRLLVRGTRIPYEEAEEIVEEQIQFEEKPTSTWMEQYLLGLFYGSGVVIAAGIVYLIYRSKKRGKYEED